MKDGFIKVATATPELKVADTVFNTNTCIELAERAYGMATEPGVSPSHSSSIPP